MHTQILVSNLVYSSGFFFFFFLESLEFVLCRFPEQHASWGSAKCGALSQTACAFCAFTALELSNFPVPGWEFKHISQQP